MKAALVSKERMNEHCLPGQGAKCCRYLAAGSAGIICLKLTGLKKTLDERVEQKTMTARGDNCDGIISIEIKKEKHGTI